VVTQSGKFENAFQVKHVPVTIAQQAVAATPLVANDQNIANRSVVPTTVSNSLGTNMGQFVLSNGDVFYINNELVSAQTNNFGYIFDGDTTSTSYVGARQGVQNPPGSHAPPPLYYYEPIGNVTVNYIELVVLKNNQEAVLGISVVEGTTDTPVTLTSASYPYGMLPTGTIPTTFTFEPVVIGPNKLLKIQLMDQEGTLLNWYEMKFGYQ